MQSEVYKIDLGGLRFSVRTHSASFECNRKREVVNGEESFKMVHTHSAYELFAVIGGNLVITTEGETFSCSDSIVIIPSNFRHYANFNNTSTVILNFVVDPHNQDDMNMYDCITSNISEEVVIFPINQNERFYCEKLIMEKNKNKFHEVRENLLALLFSEIFSRYLPDEMLDTSYVPKKSQYVTAIDTYIAVNSNRRIYLDDLARELHLCSKQVSRIIKKEYGCTLSELVMRHRIGIAQMLLVKTDMKSYEISVSVGYESPKDFRLNFKKACGVTPTEYRKQMKVKN